MSATALDALAGRRERALADLPSVRRLVDVLDARCREVSWIRTSVASLDRFASLTGQRDLEALLERARSAPRAAEDALAAFADALSSFTRPQIAALAMGPKLWFTFNGVAVPWRPLPGREAPAPIAGSASPLDLIVLLSLIGSGLRRAEFLRLRVGDIGSLDRDGELVADLEAEPLAVRYRQQRGCRAYLTFLTYGAREVLLAELRRRARDGSLDADAPLLARPDGSAATDATVARANRVNRALIGAGNNVNVEMCRKTGDFFRSWGMPGSRFVESPSVEERV
ncbi:MAG: hypothetical protein ACLPYS_02180 [Vulcanimicrobiaceae bacterium]